MIQRNSPHYSPPQRSRRSRFLDDCWLTVARRFRYVGLSNGYTGDTEVGIILLIIHLPRPKGRIRRERYKGAQVGRTDGSHPAHILPLAKPPSHA